MPILVMQQIPMVSKTQVQTMAVHSRNTSTLGGRGWRVTSSSPAQATYLPNENLSQNFFKQIVFKVLGSSLMKSPGFNFQSQASKQQRNVKSSKISKIHPVDKDA